MAIDLTKINYRFDPTGEEEKKKTGKFLRWNEKNKKINAGRTDVIN